jgi:competence protein ComEA
VLKKAGTFFFGLSLGILGGLLAAGLILLVTSKPRGEAIELLPIPSPLPLQVYVSGAVSTPGVYVLPHGAIIENALEEAGGLLPEADLSRLNLAAPLSSGQHIFVPHQTTDVESLPNDPLLEDVHPPIARLNVNQATAAELELLPGIGPVLAKKIIEYRTNHGLFTHPEDLMNVSGIGPSIYEAVKDFITVH